YLVCKIQIFLVNSFVNLKESYRFTVPSIATKYIMLSIPSPVSISTALFSPISKKEWTFSQCPHSLMA
ncbi:hypothetical protein, partial [Bacillus licheniformis]|uniref:hypothetical protein n=1 Tax=Bacillus licheniformis TaxID=1402 RepID=UPI003396091D